MASKSGITIPKYIIDMDKNIGKAVNKGITDVTMDLLQVAQQRTPVNSTTLEKSGTKKLSLSNTKKEGIVSFRAVNNGFNYAVKMNDTSYNLGEQSRSKSSRGVRSKFSKASMKVGSGYLTDSAEQCQEGYTEHVNKLIKNCIKK